MPVTAGDVEAFFERHPEFAQEKEQTVKMAKGSVSPSGFINFEAIDWVFRDERLLALFIGEQSCPKI